MERPIARPTKPTEDRVTLRAARPDEAALLSALALRSKAHWGYDEAFLEACRAELTIGPEDVEARRTTVAISDGVVVGFSSLEGAPPVGEVGALFVDPPAIGSGVGRLLWRHLALCARRDGFVSLTIDADPDACGFYLRMGAVRRGGTLGLHSGPDAAALRLSRRMTSGVSRTGCGSGILRARFPS
jgi:GNAT superfamily N-acetyltransferase